ncbi:hypothetical protein F4679DRAFT_535452 [Xylaria curta]|nr:hypothetical protein F4679DRAFT_535452 [Xylaria curta]
MAITIYSGFRFLLLLLCLQGVALGQDPPTLVYNCARLPSICRNVNSRNPLLAVPGVAAAGNIGKLDPGRTPGGLNYIELTFDLSSTNKNDRRDLACPSSWYRNLANACPRNDQPRVVTGQQSWGSGYTGQRYVQQGVVFGEAGYNVIANQANTGPAGVFWSCDEWPPATTTQGGAGAHTYCAPQNYKCSSKLRVSLGSGVDSEQDIQGRSHNVLRNILIRLNPGSTQTTFTFRFQTAWDDTNGSPGAYVEYPDGHGGEFRENAFKRSLPTFQKNYALIYGNGSVMSYTRPMTEDEILYHNQSLYSQELMPRANMITSSKLNSSIVVGNMSAISPARQRFEKLPEAPPLPIVSLARIFIDRLAKVSIQPYISQVLDLLPGSMVPNTTHLTSNTPSHKSLQERTGQLDHTSADAIFSRQNTNQCSATSPCPDGSCCNKDGGCGYGPANCGKGNCTNTCDATAMCGRDSLGGKVSCPLNVCCSYYGYCGTGDQFCSSPQPNAPCQKGFGSCSTVSAPSCGGSSALGRTMAYYQVSNSYSRQCERITPAQINTTGLTHLILAFVSIDPKTFQVVPVDSRDVPLYTQFTALKTSKLQTWVSVGGWDFNDPGPTQTTFSDIVASATNRATFIASLKSFMAKYGFQGIDIDWEYPGAPDRSGKPGDTANFVTLLKEMRASFGTSYGISATIPASYWYLRWFDPINMAPYVDFFNLLSYDLHGPWDKTVVDIGPVIIGQTNIPELYNWTLPLWYDKVDPGKINMGLAYYGRGYTVADVDCTKVGCKWSGPSRPAPCTNFGGVMSLQELQAVVIPEVGVKPILDSDAMMKYLVWSDQWIGYDDLDTIAMKKTWASSHCFGGTVIWSIDLYSGAGSGNTPDGQGNSSTSDPGGSGGNSGGTGEGGDSIVYIDPSIWNSPAPVINCEPPCTFVLPPLQLPTPSTVTFPLYTTSLDVAWSASTGWTSIIQTTTLTIPHYVITEIPVWEYTVTDTVTATTIISTFYVTESIRPPPFTITDDPNPLRQSGVTHPPVTRTITPPPYPYSFTSPASRPTTTTTTTGTTGIVPFPIVTYKPGKPGPICKSHCGTPCFIFCDTPCLLDCSDGGNDFPDPVNPKPPPRPKPTEENDPPPTSAKVTTAKPEPTDVAGDDPGDEEEEDEDDQCAFEFALPAPTYVDPNFGASGTQTVSPAKPPPTTQPTSNPKPPSPNPSTESLHCYNSGASTDRGSMIDGVNDFCNYFEGAVLDDSDPNSRKTLTYTLDNIDVTGGTAAACVFTAGISGCWEYLTLQVTVMNGCRFTIDGPSPSDDCGRIFRKAIDKCDTSSTQYKQGGTITSNCAVWRIDPNVED